jgi:hypothetical protein
MKSFVFVGLLLTFALAVYADTSATDLLGMFFRNRLVESKKKKRKNQLTRFFHI